MKWQEYLVIISLSLCYSQYLIHSNTFPIVSSIFSFAPGPSGKSQQVEVEMAGH